MPRYPVPFVRWVAVTLDCALGQQSTTRHLHGIENPRIDTRQARRELRHQAAPRSQQRYRELARFVDSRFHGETIRTTGSRTDRPTCSRKAGILTEFGGAAVDALPASQRPAGVAIKRSVAVQLERDVQASRRRA